MKINQTKYSNLAAPTVYKSGTGSLLRLVSLFVPLGILGILGIINSIGTWPVFRQQDASLLNWILASNSEALKGFTHDIESEPESQPIQGINRLWNFLGNLGKNYLTLQNINLSGLDLGSTDFGDMSLENVSLAGARLINSDFSCSDLTGVNFSGAKLMNSKFDYSREKCNDHISTKGAQRSLPWDKSKRNNQQDLPRSYMCGQYTQKILAKQYEKGNYWPFRAQNPNQKPNPKPNTKDAPPTYTCLEANFTGADFSNSQIRGDRSRRRDNDVMNNHYCHDVLILVGNMSGANFNNTKLTCVALIHRPTPEAPKQEINEKTFTYNGINFAEARLDRVSLLEGPFRFTQFERANLKGLYLDLENADLDYSRFNEIKCDAPNAQAKDTDPKLKIQQNNGTKKPQYPPCLWVQRDRNHKPLHLNFLWSTLVTNLKPIKKDSFLCTPPTDLPASVEDKQVVSTGYWLTTKTKMNSNARDKSTIDKPIELECPSTHLLSTEAKLPSNH